MLPLLKPYDTLADIYRAIITNPEEDTPRLMFADACQEVDGPPKAIVDWGRLIKMQFELERIGPQRTKVLVSHVVARGGSDYCQFHVGEESGVKPGDRVDVETMPPSRLLEVHKQDSDPKRYYGLKITRVQLYDADGLLLITAKRDEESVKYPQEQVDYLNGKTAGIILNHREKWIPDELHYHLVVNDYDCEIYRMILGQSVTEQGIAQKPQEIVQFVKGFPSKIAKDWNWWRDFGDTVIQLLPVSRVELLSVPSLFLSRYQSGAPDFVTGTIRALRLRWPSVAHWKFPES